MLRIDSTIMTGAAKVPIPRNGVDYRRKIVLAPMVRSGELPSRLLALHYGADLVWGPETVDRSMIGTRRRVNETLHTIDFVRFPSHSRKNLLSGDKESSIFRLHPEREGKRLIFQMGTSDPARAVEAARIVAKDVAGIDVNAGCPKPFSISGGMGAALLQTPDKLCSILEALVKEISTEFEIGISVKIRLLETPELTKNLVQKLCATGIIGLTIHCRTTPMRPRERAIRDQLKMIAEICRETGVACLMNGDVESRSEAEQLMTQYGVDGAMIATAAESNPSCFRSSAAGGLAPWDEVVEEYMRTCLEVENRFGNTKYLLNHLIPGKQPVHRQITTSKSYQQTCELLALDSLQARAREVDENLAIRPEFEVKSKRSKKNKNKSAIAAAGLQGKSRALDSMHKKAISQRGVSYQAAATIAISEF